MSVSPGPHRQTHQAIALGVDSCLAGQHVALHRDRLAITRGGQLASEEGAELVIHGQGGEIRQKNSHGNDPRDVPG
jgi:Uncharacterized protein conserved in bacteria (DUF2188)